MSGFFLGMWIRTLGEPYVSILRWAGAGALLGLVVLSLWTWLDPKTWHPKGSLYWRLKGRR